MSVVGSNARRIDYMYLAGVAVAVAGASYPSLKRTAIPSGDTRNAC